MIEEATGQWTDLDQDLIRRRLQGSGMPPAEALRLPAEIGRRLLEQLALVNIAPPVVLDCSAASASLAEALRGRFRRARTLAADLPGQPLRALAGVPRWRWGGRVACMAADQRRLPLRSDSVALLTSSLGIHRHPDPDAVLEEFARVLQPDGLLMLASVGPDTLRELREAWRAADALTHVHPFVDMHDLGDAIARAGFADVVIHVDRITCHYPDLDTLHADLRLAGVANASEHRSRSLTTPRQLARVHAAYEAIRSAQGLPVSVEVVYAHAWRRAPRAVSVPFPTRQR